MVESMMSRCRKSLNRWLIFGCTGRANIKFCTKEKLKVNGQLANGLDVIASPIGFQSEGGEIHFRNVEPRPN